MASDEGFREEVKAVIRKHDPDADDLRTLSDDLLGLAEKYETLEDEL